MTLEPRPGLAMPETSQRPKWQGNLGCKESASKRRRAALGRPVIRDGSHVFPLFRRKRPSVAPSHSRRYHRHRLEGCCTRVISIVPPHAVAEAAGVNIWQRTCFRGTATLVVARPGNARRRNWSRAFLASRGITSVLGRHARPRPDRRQPETAVPICCPSSRQAAQPEA